MPNPACMVVLDWYIIIKQFYKSINKSMSQYYMSMNYEIWYR